MRIHSTISLEPELAERLHRFSRKHDIPKSHIHAEAIKTWLDDHEDKNQKANQK